MNGDEFWQQVQENILKTGVHLTGVFDPRGGPPWTYTTGRFIRREPELCVAGLSFEVANIVLNELSEIPGLHAGPVDAFDGGVESCLIDVIDLQNEAYPHNVTLSLARTLGVSTSQVSALQLCWPDENNRFPWDGWDMDDGVQPLFGVQT